MYEDFELESRRQHYQITDENNEDFLELKKSIENEFLFTENLEELKEDLDLIF